MLGAVAIVCRYAVESNLPQIIVEDTRIAYALISKAFFGNAIDDLKLITVVGTNGKTSTATILNRILTLSGVKTGQIGTLGARILDKKIEADMTTPDPYVMHRLFYKMKKAGVEVVIMEATAHAIHHKKMMGTVADISIFTNVSQDHLDFFGDMERYKNTKKSYFCGDFVKLAVINFDDIAGREIAAECRIARYLISGLTNF
jgi:UDP-N-acetylmuramoyl-L-alanyl-D-glutamate--2,6-diaminopimelate ligase